MTSLKVDYIVSTYGEMDVTLELSGLATSGQYAAVTGFVDSSNNVLTTGVISGSVFKTSGNVTVISSSGKVSPYGLYDLPSTQGTPPTPLNNTVLTTVSGRNLDWTTVSTTRSTAFSIALGKC